MSFEPNTGMLKFQNGGETNAFAFLRDLQGNEPFHDALQAYPLEDVPDQIQPKSETILPLGPFSVEGSCPETGRRLHLHVFRDLSGVILREGPNGGPTFEVLPACVTIPSQVYHKTLKETPYEERQNTVPFVKFQARDGGLRWSQKSHWLNKSGDISQEEIQRLLTDAMEEKARAILAAPRVVDPRAVEQLDDATRYAPFSKWREETSDPAAVERLKKAMMALAGLRAHAMGESHYSLTYTRSQVDEPWRPAKRYDTHRSTVGYKRGHYGTDGVLQHGLKRLAKHPSLLLKPCDRYGIGSVVIIHVDTTAAPTSSHQRLACMRVLSEVAPGFDYDFLLA